MRHMVVIVPELTGYASIRHVAVSLPYAAQLIDGVKYMLPGDVKPPDGGTERRRQRAPRAHQCARWSGGRGNATAPTTRRAAEKGAIVGSNGAPDWCRRAMPVPRTNSSKYSAIRSRRSLHAEFRHAVRARLSASRSRLDIVHHLEHGQRFECAERCVAHRRQLCGSSTFWAASELGSAHPRTTDMQRLLQHVGVPILLQKSKLSDAENLAKIDF